MYSKNCTFTETYYNAEMHMKKFTISRNSRRRNREIAGVTSKKEEDFGGRWIEIFIFHRIFCRFLILK